MLNYKGHTTLEKHQSNCTRAENECAKTWVCAKCEYVVGDCYGSDDSDPYLFSLCDDCWLEQVTA